MTLMAVPYLGSKNQSSYGNIMSSYAMPKTTKPISAATEAATAIRAKQQWKQYGWQFPSAALMKHRTSLRKKLFVHLSPVVGRYVKTLHSCSVFLLGGRFAA